MEEPAADFQQARSTAIEPQHAPNSTGNSTKPEKPVVVGLYGVPGAGKTFLLNQLKDKLGEEHFAFYDGSQMISDVTCGSLEDFTKLTEQGKLYWRQVAIDKIQKECADSGRSGVVAGHFMFWDENEEVGRQVCTQNDLDTYTHIIYLDTSPDTIKKHRLNDAGRTRPPVSMSHLRNWQEAERTQLRHLCRLHGILFLSLSPSRALLGKVCQLLHDFRVHSEEYNMSYAKRRLDEFILASSGQVETMVVMDADKTLAPQDAGSLFWEILNRPGKLRDKDPLKTLFSSPLGYSYTAFRQATLLYEECTDVKEFDTVCDTVAAEVVLYSEFVSLLELIAEQGHVGAVIITCGLRQVWEKVLERYGLSKMVKVMGGGRKEDGFVITPAVKAGLVAQLGGKHGMYVWAFGDSPLDLPMLREADQAIVVVGNERTRSKSMDEALVNAIDYGGLQARQVVLPSCVTPRLDISRLPLAQFTGYGLSHSIFALRNRQPAIQVVHATDKSAAKLLMTPTRDAKLSGHDLRKAHGRVGWYLATEFLTELVGTEEYTIAHVQGRETTGHRLLGEERTLIVALMRGGEPMALGVSKAFPLAMFLHAACPEDIKAHHLEGKCTVMLVDSVINSGKTVLEFVRYVRKVHATLRIVVVAGVVQDQFFQKRPAQTLVHQKTQFSVVALRVSSNKYAGKGATDTGNRLYNTTQLS
ncbi:hypothetical protein AJ79_08470 [Helicocarpus griseus UAMH5409]|uniref:Phosphoribosyltransferase domain-containing protein n=1 Tax=Helicocarpus griseus UAMH5409 TaxID=1447875 RepID=A0A2B7WT22_9EURO|nr:hypothetical protein AJ79_08470 [Helicocarpus griseus UAMH5409]